MHTYKFLGMHSTVYLISDILYHLDVRQLLNVFIKLTKEESKITENLNINFFNENNFISNGNCYLLTAFY